MGENHRGFPWSDADIVVLLDPITSIPMDLAEPDFTLPLATIRTSWTRSETVLRVSKGMRVVMRKYLTSQ